MHMTAAKHMKPDPEFDAAADSAFRASRDELAGFISELERCAEQAQQVKDQAAEIYARAKARGYDTKAIKAVIKAKNTDPAKRAEAQEVFDFYMEVLGL